MFVEFTYWRSESEMGEEPAEEPYARSAVCSLDAICLVQQDDEVPWQSVSVHGRHIGYVTEETAMALMRIMDQTPIIDAEE